MEPIWITLKWLNHRRTEPVINWTEKEPNQLKTEPKKNRTSYKLNQKRTELFLTRNRFQPETVWSWIKTVYTAPLTNRNPSAPNRLLPGLFTTRTELKPLKNKPKPNRTDNYLNRTKTDPWDN